MIEFIYDGSIEELELKQQFTEAIDELMGKDERVVLGDADVGSPFMAVV